MKWRESRKGNTYVTHEDILALVTPDLDSEGYLLTLKITRAFDNEYEAKEAAEDMIEALHDAELTNFFR